MQAQRFATSVEDLDILLPIAGPTLPTACRREQEKEASGHCSTGSSDCPFDWQASTKVARREAHPRRPRLKPQPQLQLQTMQLWRHRWQSLTSCWPITKPVQPVLEQPTASRRLKACKGSTYTLDAMETCSSTPKHKQKGAASVASGPRWSKLISVSHR